MRDRQRETDGDRRVDGVAAFLQHGDADVGGGGFHRHDHPVPRAQRLPGRQRDRKEKAGGEHEKRDSSHRGIVVGRTALVVCH